MNTRNYFFVIKVILLLYISILSSIHSSAQEADSLYYTNPDYHVAKELFNKRIVILGDYAHHQPGPYKRVFEILNNWLQFCTAKEESTKLVYIIENESAFTDGLNEYIATGDIKPIVNPEYYLTDFEYFAKLRDFSRMVDSVNINRINKISFIVKGFEEIGAINFEKMAIKPRRESELWFINERDSTTAAGIINYLKTNPDEQVLMFYGDFHLMNGYINKNLGWDDLTQTECMGYCLSHYLKQEFGNVNVITYYTGSYDKFIMNPLLEPVKGKEYITRPINFKNPQLTDTVDYIYSCHTHYYQLAQGFYINSKFIFEYIVNYLKRVKNWLPGYKATIYYNWFLGSINTMVDTNFKDDIELDNWLANNSFNGTDSLYSNRITDKLAERLVQFHNKDYINSVISRYGIAFTIIDSDMVNFDKWKENELPQILDHIKFTNSIGIYWFGYPDEKIKAKEYLVKFSGEDFAEPEKYLQWYRKTYFDYDY